MSANPKRAVVQETGECIGWICMSCSRLHTTAIYLTSSEVAEAEALAVATKCCVPQKCACGAEAKTYSGLCLKCWREQQDAKDRARWEAEPKKTIAEYLEQYPDGYVSDGEERFWSISDYIADECYLHHPRVWFCEPLRGIELDADNVIESWADERHEDARDDLDLNGLQKLLDEWCAKQKTVSWFVTGEALDPSEVERLCRERAVADEALGADE